MKVNKYNTPNAINDSNLETNEVVIEISAKDLEKLVKKHGGKLTYDDFGKKLKSLDLTNKTLIDGNYEFERSGPLIIFNQKEKRLVINKIGQGAQQLSITEKFLKELSAISKRNFKIAILDEEVHAPIYFRSFNGKTRYELLPEDDWLYHSNIQKIIKEKKIKKDKSGSYDSDQLYDICYDAYDNLLSDPELLAPEWFYDDKKFVKNKS